MPFKLVIDKKYSIDCSPLGKITNIKLKNLYDILAKKGFNYKNEKSQTFFSQISDEMYVTFPKEAVKAGDMFSSEKLHMKYPGFGKISILQKNKIIAISKNKELAIISISGTVSMQSSIIKKLNAKVTGAKIKGWMLFNIKKGKIKEYKAIFSLGIKASQHGTTIGFNNEVVTSYSSDI